MGFCATPIKDAAWFADEQHLCSGKFFVPSPKLDFPGLKDVMTRYQAKAPDLKIDPLGHSFVPFGYAAGRGTGAGGGRDEKSRSSLKIARLHAQAPGFNTVVGDISFGDDGEWSKSRQFFTRFRGVVSNGGMEQFRDGSRQVILWPPEYKTGDIIYPYDAAKK